MNTTYKLLTMMLLAIGMQSCEKMLQEEPKTVLSPEQFLQNPGSYETSVKGIYSGLPLYVSFTHEMITDLYAPPSAAAEQALPIYNNQPTPFYFNARNAWNGPYSMIKNANFILHYLPAAPLDETFKNQLTAEARFLRGYAFFNLVQLFGDVPMPLLLAENYDNLRLPRTPQTEVYEQIVQDLLFAEDNLPDQARQVGRVYKLAATALLARVYLTMAGNPLNQTERFSDALEKARLVINSQRFSLTEDYAAAFHNMAYTSESIWDKQYVPGRGGNGLHSASATAEGYVPTLIPSSNFIQSFPTGDRRLAWGIMQNYPAPNGPLQRPFFHKFVDAALIDRGVLPSGAQVSFSIPLLRYAEMFLIAAEAENALNGPAQAYAYVNEIRRRARVDKGNPTHVPDLSDLTQEQLQQAIWKEWDWEMHQEGLSWMTMKRTNTFNRIQQQRGATLVVPVGLYNQTWPIPIEEITNNNIPQNPLYQ
ncbi:RagB/SusD family nutrient uptake outer membrane protein [Sphingobacterium paludis]|uniref:SusD-like starch-binding protein associating with outer membrane n=1 Tax=Sphingobacterium paludis TaxID=1476465 RepID=A0A4R7D3H8_9SPHI|nr:RagB/SusD family nutrient uptake outer membrane protein [Sphingobacterium paludis]TDS14681.1 SusD-like starch-binding protein associating with outer membrane [Sphingobacterium paludis]